MKINFELTEKEIEDVLKDYLDAIALPENKERRSKLISSRDFNMITHNNKITVFRQLDLGGVRCDLLTHERKGSKHLINLFELKREEVNSKTFIQAMKYKCYIDKFFKERDIDNYFIRVHLIAPFIDYDTNYINGVEGLNYDVSIRAIEFYPSHGILFSDYSNYVR
jgi:hypothetical protein